VTRYDIELLGFPSVPEDEAARGLARTFGIAPDEALAMVRGAPRAVKSDCGPEDTQRFIKALLHIGADVSVSNGVRSKVYRTEVRHRERSAPQRPPVRPYELGPDDDDGLLRDPRPFDVRAALGASRAAPSQPSPPQVGAPLPGATLAGATLATAMGPVAPSPPSPGPLASGVALPSRGPITAFRREDSGGTKVPLSGPVWKHLGEALIYPVLGGGVRWMLVIAFVSAVLVGFSFLQLFMFGFMKILVMGLILMLLAGLYSLQARLLAFCLWGGATGDRGGPDPPGDLDEFKGNYALPGFVLLIASIGLYVPLFAVAISRAKTAGLGAVVDFLGSPLGTLLALLPFLYWPVGLALVAQKGTVAEIANAPGIIRGAWRGGFEYVLIAAIGLLGPWVATVVPRLAEDARAVIALQPLLLTVIFGYIAGVQGYLLGVLYRRKPGVLAG
jgi:hypothetical protein